MSSTVTGMKTAALAVALFLAPAALAGSRSLLVVGNGARPFAGDRPDLTTISPNGDGYRDTASISYAPATGGVARLAVDRADRKGRVLVETRAAGSELTWAPAATLATGTYIVAVSSAKAPTAHAV